MFFSLSPLSCLFRAAVFRARDVPPGVPGAPANEPLAIDVEYVNRTAGTHLVMGLMDSIRRLFQRSDAAEIARQEPRSEPTDQPKADAESFEEVKDDDSIARGTTSVAPTLGAGTSAELRDEFEADQSAPRP